MTTLPPKTLAPAKRPLPVPPSAPTPVTAKVAFGTIDTKRGHRIELYGTGGIGKTSLACIAPGPVAFIDLDESLPTLKTQLEELGITLPVPVASAKNCATFRTALQAPGWDSINTIVIDTVTKLEEWVVAYTLETVPNDKGHKVKRLEDYGYGKGFQHVFDTFLPILSDLDAHVRAGRNVILIAHECVSPVPNPNGEDWIRYEPRLQSPNSGKASIRHRIKEWADHVLFLGYDVAVSKEGKAAGSGTRTLYTAEMPWCMAKSRTTSEQFSIEQGVSPWEQIIK